MKNFTPSIRNFLFVILSIFALNHVYSDEKLLTFKVSVDVEKILNLKDFDFGIKANTQGGKVEVRVYIADLYNFNHQQVNPALIYGFYSERNSDNTIFYRNPWIAEEYWPWHCAGAVNFFCSENSKIKNLSTNRIWMSNRVHNHYKSKHNNFNFFNGFHGYGGTTIDLIVEIDYKIATIKYSNFEYELRLPGFDEPLTKLFIDNEDYKYARQGVFDLNILPPFRNALFSISFPDTSTLTTIDFKKERRIISVNIFAVFPIPWIRKAYTYEAKYDNGQRVLFDVIKRKEDGSDFSRADADGIANDMAVKLGKLPLIVRKGVSNITIVDNVHEILTEGYAFHHPPTNTIYIDDYEDIQFLFHESCHASLQYILILPGFLYAQAQNPTYISYYHKEHPIKESITESFPAWVKLRYFPNTNLLVNQKILEAIPKTIDYFDNKFKPEDMYPLVAAEIPKIDHYVIDAPVDGTTLNYGVNNLNIVLKKDADTNNEPIATYKLAVQVTDATSDFKYFKEFNSDEEIILATAKYELYKLGSGDHSLSISILYPGGTVSNVGGSPLNIKINPIPKGTYYVDYPDDDLYRKSYAGKPLNFNINRTGSLGLEPEKNYTIDLTVTDSQGIALNWNETTKGNNIMYGRLNDYLRWTPIKTGTYTVSGTVTPEGEEPQQLLETSFVIYPNPTVLEFAIPDGTFFPFGESISLIIKHRHDHDLKGTEVISDVKLYANDMEITTTNDFGDGYNFDNDNRTIEISRIWKPEEAGSYFLKGSLKIDGVEMYIKETFIYVNEATDEANPAPPNVPRFDTADGPASVTQDQSIDAMVSEDGRCKLYQVAGEGYALYRFEDKTTSVFNTGEQDFSTTASNNVATLSTLPGLTIQNTENSRGLVWQGLGAGLQAEAPYTLHLYSKEALNALNLITSRDLITEDDDGCVLTGISNNTNNHVSWSDEDGGAYVPPLFDTSFDNNVKHFSEINNTSNKKIVSHDGRCSVEVNANYGMGIYRYETPTVPVYSSHAANVLPQQEYYIKPYVASGPTLRYRNGSNVEIEIWKANIQDTPRNAGDFYYLYIYSREELENAIAMGQDITLPFSQNQTVPNYILRTDLMQKFLNGDPTYDYYISNLGEGVGGDDDGCISFFYNDLNGSARYRWVDEAGGKEVASARVATSSISPAILIPNPASNEVIVDFEATQPGTVTIEVVSLTSTVLLTHTVTVNQGKQQASIDTSLLADGFYILRGSGAATFSNKLSIKH